MAISLLNSGNSGAVATSSTTTVAVTVSAGNGNRKLLVGIAIESASGNVAPATVTFNGQELVALGLQVPSTSQNPNSLARTVFYEQFEAGMPGNGSNNLQVTWSATTGAALVAYWLLDGCRQDQTATGASTSVTQGTGGAATTLTAAIAAGDTGSFLASVGYRNNTTGSLQLTAPASSTTHIDSGAGGGGNRLAAASKLGSLTAGSNNATWTFSSTTDRRSMSVVVVNPAPDPRNASGTLTLGAATTAGLLLTTQREVDGAAALPAVGVNASMRLILEASGALQLGAAQVAGGLEVEVAISGDIALAPITVFGSTEEFRAISGNVDLGAVQASGALEVIIHLNASIGLPVVTAGNLDVLTAISGGFELGAAQVAGDVERRVHISGAVQLAAAQVAGDVVHVRAISGGFLLPVVLAGELRTQFPGSCVLRDAPAYSAELTHEAAGFATLQDGTAGTVEIGLA